MKPRAPSHDRLPTYLAVLAGAAPASAFLELRHRVGARAMATEFHRVEDRNALVESIRRRGADTDVYVGCAPRCRSSGTKRDIEQVWVLWAECDSAAAARAAWTYEPRPPVVIASGSGPNLHAYWPMRQPLTARTAEEANLRLAHALNADLACYDAARMLSPGIRIAQLAIYRLDYPAPPREDEEEKYLAPVRPQPSRLSSERGDFESLDSLGNTLRSPLG